ALCRSIRNASKASSCAIDDRFGPSPKSPAIFFKKAKSDGYFPVVSSVVSLLSLAAYSAWRKRSRLLLPIPTSPRMHDNPCRLSIANRIFASAPLNDIVWYMQVGLGEMEKTGFAIVVFISPQVTDNQW